MKLSTSVFALAGTAALPKIYGAVIERQAAAISAVSASDWSALNTTVGGRLGVGIPYGKPCFSKYKGVGSSVDATVCNERRTRILEEKYRLEVFGSAMYSQWESCPAKNSYCQLNALNPSDTTPFAPPSDCGQGSVAPYYIAVKEPNDVTAAFTFSKKTGVPITIKNTGHDFSGRSHGVNSLSLWTHYLQDISRNQKFIPQSCPSTTTGIDAVTIGAGVWWEKTYKWAEANSVTVIGGSCPTVGSAGGWLQGGGHGPLTPNYGMGVDRVLQFKIVTPDGQLRYANACQNTDLFYALRGGGGGTWGVVLEVTYKLEPKLKLQVYNVTFAATPVSTRAFTSIMIENSIKLSEDGWGGFITPNGIQFANPKLTTAQAAISLKPVTDFMATLGAAFSGTNAVYEVPSFWIWESQIIAPFMNVGSGLQGGTGGRLIQKPNFASAAKRTELLEAMLKVYSQSSGAAVMFTAPYNYKPVEGATSVHPGWRSAVWTVLTLHLGWDWNSDAAALKARYAEVTATNDILRKITPWSDAGVYISEADAYEPDWKNAYFGSNYPKLLEIKQKYDPTGLLDCFRCVGWKGPTDPRYQCYV